MKTNDRKTNKDVQCQEDKLYLFSLGETE